jgi:hypothetical protein
MARRQKSQSEKSHGQSMAEITLLLPILLLIFTAMAEMGWWVHSYVTVATAAREGARFGSRGMHLPTQDIADVTQVAMNALNIRLYGADANATILVSEIDVDPDGSYQIVETYKLGDLDVTSQICLEGSCEGAALDLTTVRQENIAFNSDPELCDEALGCRNDVVIVEVFYLHDLVLNTIFSADYIPPVIPVTGRSVMRVLFRRSPWG